MERLGNFPKVMARKGWSWDNESRKSSTEDNKGPGEYISVGSPSPPLTFPTTLPGRDN